MGGADASSTRADRELVSRARAGDRAAQRVLYDSYRQGLDSYLRHMTGSADVAEELAQETFVRAFTHLPRLRSETAFGGWLYRIARNLLRDRAAVPRTADESAALELADPQAEVPRRSEQADLAAAVEAALATLPAPQREAVVLHHLEGFDVAHIAGVAGVRVGTIKSRLARAREALRRKLLPFVEG